MAYGRLLFNRKMASTTSRALRQTWQVTDKANPFMAKSGAKTTQKRNINDMTRHTANPNANQGLATFFGRTFKNFLGENTTETSMNWAQWESNIRANIARHVREQEQREIAFKRMMHRV